MDKLPAVTFRMCEFPLDDELTLCSVRGKRCDRCRSNWCVEHFDWHAGPYSDTNARSLCDDFSDGSKAGRPSLADPRSRMINFRITESEFQEMTAAAKLDGYSVSDWLRMLIRAALDTYPPVTSRAPDAAPDEEEK